MPLLLHSLSDDERIFLEPVFKAHFGMSIESQLKSQIALELLRRHELARVSRVLKEKHIPFLVFKGSALAYELYDMPHLRERCDTDLLFRNRHDADQAWSLIEPLGYRRGMAVDGELVTSEFSCFRGENGGSIVFDLHWNTSNLAHCRSISFEDIYQSSREMLDVAPGARMPSLVHAFVLACHHRLAHAPLGEQDRLIWLYDLHLLVQSFSENDTALLLDIAREHDIASALVDGIAAMNRFFPTEVDSAWMSELEALSAKSRRQIKGQQSLLMADLASIREQSGWQNKFALVREYLFPSAEYLKQKYGFNSSWRLPYYYLKRIVAGVKKRVG